MGIGSRGINIEQKHLPNQRYIDLRNIPGKDKKLRLKTMAAARNCGKWRRYREKMGGGLSR